MIVIVEGLDGVGKTTITEKIAERYNYEYIKESYTNIYKEKELRIAHMLIRLFNDKDYIYDRTTLIDDFVYDFLNPVESSLLPYFDIIIAILSKCKIIHLELDETKRQKRFNERGDQYITNNDIKQIDKNYKDFYKSLNNVQHITLTGNINQDIQKIMEVIND